MSLGERLVRWSIAVGFGLLAFVTGLAAALIVVTGQPGNVWLLSVAAIGSATITFVLCRTLKRSA